MKLEVVLHVDVQPATDEQLPEAEARRELFHQIADEVESADPGTFSVWSRADRELLEYEVVSWAAEIGDGDTIRAMFSDRANP